MLGIGSYSFTWAAGVPGHPPARRFGALDLLTEAGRLGVRVVQVCENVPFATLPESELAVFEARARAANVQVELGTRGLNADRLRQHLRLVQRFGGRFLRLVLSEGDDHPTPEEAAQRLDAILPEFEAAGVRLAIENHDRFRALELAGLIERLGPQRVGVTLDTVNSFGATEGPATVVPLLAPYTVCLHVKDFTLRRPAHQMGFLLEGCPAGAGRLDVPWLLAQLRVSPHPFNVILETWVTPSESLDETIARERDWTAQGLRYLRTLIPD